MTCETTGSCFEAMTLKILIFFLTEQVILEATGTREALGIQRSL